MNDVARFLFITRRYGKRTGFTTSYDGFTVTETVCDALKKGTNTLAVHTRQTAGGQFIDLALLIE